MKNDITEEVCNCKDCQWPDDSEQGGAGIMLKILGVVLGVLGIIGTLIVVL